MKRTLWTAVLAAGVLLVAGCSSNSAGTGSAASTTAAASSAEAMTSEAMTSEAMTSEAMTSEAMTSASSGSESSGSESSSESGGSASVAPAALDEQTTTWFTTLCEGIAPISELSKLDTSGQDAATAQKTGVQALQLFGSALTDTSAKLTAAPPPTFEGGADFANQLTSGLAASGPKLKALAVTFGAIDPTNTAALQQGIQGLSAELSSAVAPLQQLQQLPPAVSESVKNIPACAALGN